MEENRMSKQDEAAGNDFRYALLPAVNKRVFRMGIAGNYGMDSPDALAAAEHGANYWVWGASYGRVGQGLRRIIGRDRDRHVIAMLGWGLLGRQVEWSVNQALKQLDTDYLDVFTLGWLGRTSVHSAGVMDTLLDLKRRGRIRAVGVSIHDRKRAALLALDSEIDLFMIRYNAKHTGAEQDIFPFLGRRNPAVVSYTALAWEQLVRPIRGMGLAPLTPELCYRFVLSNPHVHLVLTGPKNRDQLLSNLATLEKGPLSASEMQEVRRYGALVKAMKRLDYVR
jgi:aryl-alcohol dehydrogenase-like predicted oxidoreductase